MFKAAISHFLIFHFVKVNHLVKELLVMGELNQQQKDAIKKLTAVEGQNPESNMQFHGCQRELAGESGGWSWLVFVTQN